MAEVGKISVRVSPDTSNFRRDLQRQLERIERASEVRVNVNPDLTGFRQRIAASVKGLKTEVAVVPDVKTFRGSVKSMLSGVGDSLANIKAPSFGSGISGTGYAAIAAAIAALSPLIAGLLGALTTSLLALPGLLTAVVVPIGALALGLDGLKKAAAVLKQPFDDLRATMSSKVQEQFTPAFEKLRDIFPTLKAALPSVTQGLATMAKSFSDVLTDPANLAKLDQTIQNIAKSLKEAAPGIADFTRGFLDLVNGFSNKLPDIGKWFSDTGASFKKWVADFTKAGPNGVSRFDQALTTLGDTLKTLGGGLIELAGKSLDFFSDPEKVKAFKAELDGVVNTVLTLADALNGIASVMSKIPGFGDGKGDKLLDFAPVQVQWIVEMLPKIRQAVADTIAQVITMFAQVPAALGSAWSSIVGIAQGAWSGVVQAVTGAITSVVTTVVNGGTQVMTEVGSWPQKIQSFFADAGSWLVSAGQAIVQGLITGISGMITTAVAKAKELASSVKNAVTGFLGIHSPSTVMADIGGFIGDGLINGLKAKQGEIEKTVKGISQGIKDGLDTSSYAQRGIDAGISFAGANVDAFMSDIGFGGKGMLSQLVEQGFGFGTQLAGQGLTQIFHTSNVDDTIAVKNNQLNKQALGVVGKSK